MVYPSLHTPNNQNNRIVGACPQTIISESHSKTRLYKCTYCSYISKLKTNCLRHMRTHTGEKPYKCEVCNRGFSQNSYLKTHMKTHSGEKPYECKFCNRNFSRNFNLKTHMKTHNGAKKFVCDKCNTQHKLHEIYCSPNEKTISQIDNLKTSVEQHQGNKLPSKHSNQHIYSIGAQKSISSTTHSPDFTQEISKAVSQNVHLDNSITQHHQCKSYDIDYDCKFLGSLRILTDTSSADNPRNQAQYLSSSGPCLAELPNPTTEWDSNLENISSSSISKHFDGSSFSQSPFLSDASNDMKTANHVSDSENKYRTSVLESNIGPFYSMSPNSMSNNLTTDISELFIIAFDSQDSHASQIQQQPAKLSPEKKEYISL